MSNKLGKRRRLRTIMAYHEAGHAAAARVLGVDVAFVSTWRLDPDTVAAAPAHSAPWRSRGADTETRSGAAEADAKVALAGPTAEQYAPIRHPKVEHADDMKNALQGVGCAAALAAGMEIPEQGAAGFELTGAVKADALARLDRLKAETDRLVTDNWLAVVRVARALIHRDRLDQDELDRLIAGTA